MKLLILSNGHGEDVIALKILEQLGNHSKILDLAVFPLVGEGHVYRSLDIPIIGPVQLMPSGGFIYMDKQQLWGDIRGGLLKLAKAQYQVVRQWGKEGGKILAVGDIVPLLLAYLSGSDYAFVGTAKSEYYLRDEYGWLPRTSSLYRWSGCYYFPWERFLMGRTRCKAVFPRDSFTSRILRQYGIPAYDLGNPMMDDLGLQQLVSAPTQDDHCLKILLLPGSRTPEVLQNWQKIMIAVSEVISVLRKREILFLAAIAPGLSLDDFRDDLLARQWQIETSDEIIPIVNDNHALGFRYQHTQLILSQDAYRDCLEMADIAIAMAGTATEQFIGLGKPAITMPGNGPQFTERFAEAQTRLLGISVILVKHPQQVPHAIQALFQDPDRWQGIIDNGRRRMGLPGAAQRIATTLIEKLAP